MKILKSGASYKDPSGFIFSMDGEIYRQINPVYRKNYELLNSSGLYAELVQKRMLIKHTERNDLNISSAFKIIKPENIPFISYPYEWCFSQLKDAALLTLNIQKIALKYGMSLKDATSFNIQFLRGKPIFIDTLSFEKYEIGKPWTPYRQFCEQFLAPLTLYGFTDLRLNMLIKEGMGSIPLDLAVKLLPWQAKFNFGILTHLYLHAQSQKQVTQVSAKTQSSNSFSEMAMSGLIDNLEKTVLGIGFPEYKTVWTDYAGENSCESYKNLALQSKKKIVGMFLSKIKPLYVWDFGANTGEFSRIAMQNGAFTISMDFDPTVVEVNYKKVKINQEVNILPLLINLVNPSSGVGWANQERDALINRTRPDTVMALALIHHLAFTYNIPLRDIASFLANICRHLIIEFVPKTDPQAKRLLHNREDIFDAYTQKDFESEFGKFFNVLSKENIPNSERTLYLFKTR
jgi:hypothetical protein